MSIVGAGETADPRSSLLAGVGRRLVGAVHSKPILISAGFGRSGLTGCSSRTHSIRLPLRGAYCLTDSANVNAQNSVRGNLHPMNQISVADILELPVQERIQLVEVIWESIADFPNAIEVSPELKTELEARLADFERNPEAGYSWDQVKAHLKSGSWRTA